MTFANKYPPLNPSLLLDFAGSKTVDPRITFSRASSATYFDNKGVLRTAPAGVPRIDYDPVTGECRGLLVEEQRTNLLTYSEQFDNVAWTKQNSTVTPGAATAPDGTLTADMLIEAATGATTHVIFPTAAYTKTNATLTLSVFAKAGSRSSLRLEISNFLDGAGMAVFNLNTGVVSEVGGSSSDFTNTTARAIYIGDGWYRCVVTTNKGSINDVCRAVISLHNGTTVSYPGDGTSGLYIWGAQLEVVGS